MAVGAGVPGTQGRVAVARGRKRPRPTDTQDGSLRSGAAGPPDVRQGKPFHLRRWFALLSLIVIAFVSSLTAWTLSRFMTEHMIYNDAMSLTGFVQSVATAEGLREYFAGNRPADILFAEFVDHLSRLPDVLRTNVYARDRTLLWSSDHAIVGRRFHENPQLDAALAGIMEIEWGSTDRKEEHVLLPFTSERFVEIYVPVRDPKLDDVVGVVELYRVPKTLFATVDEGRRLVWYGALFSGLLIFFTLYWLVHRAERTIREQQQRLVETETLAVLGEMSAAVAHGIRNPLASIRSSAELNTSSSDPGAREAAQDVIGEVDRLEHWVRDLLTYSQPEPGVAERVDVGQLLRKAVEDCGRAMARHRIESRLHVPASLPAVDGDTALFSQVFTSLFANAFEAMPEGGELTVTAQAEGRSVVVDIADTGVGIDRDQLANIFKPFYTTKKRGLGVGLPLVRRILQRFGGSIDVQSELGQGTRVRITLVNAK